MDVWKSQMRHQARTGKEKKKSCGLLVKCGEGDKELYGFQEFALAQPQEANTSIHHLQPGITLFFHIFISDMVKTLKENEEESERGSLLSQFWFSPTRHCRICHTEELNFLTSSRKLWSLVFLYTPVSNPFSPVVVCLRVFQWDNIICKLEWVQYFIKLS